MSVSDSTSSSSESLSLSTSPSSVTSDLPKAPTYLPVPFLPPSLAVSRFPNITIDTRPRKTNSTFPPVPNEEACKEIDSQDVGTPDNWVIRDPRMVRLTGKYPFNSEAPLKTLFSKGFLTPSNLFYVRNHGPVPQVDWETARSWTLTIHGHCQKPVTFTIDDLRSKFEVVTLPITLVCAGNRRKEQNMVQKSLGFSWGGAGVSTALFTGVRLSDILAHIKPTRAAKHVIFEGCDALPNGPYGTSQLLSWARDPRQCMLIAWGMNGLALEPDHGYPLRLVVPGQIGGRSVKWLKRIELSPAESQHHLHFHDNKVLPMPIGPDRARAEMEWWYDSRYLIRDLNVNSAIACPDHGEIIEVLPEETYVLRGYAYAGGGRRITRVEISLDDGGSWELADIQYPEDAFRDVAFHDFVYGALDLTEDDQCFCWCFWSLAVPLSVLAKSASICVRAMDESLALQPRDMYWNATGMMNNWWFRVCINTLEDGRLQFEHPTMAGNQPGGWMQRLKDEGYDPAKPIFCASAPSIKESNKTNVSQVSEAVSMTRPGVDRKITTEELKAHANSQNPWFVIDGQVYDATAYLDEHPGGPQSITLVAGEDATEDYLAIHSADAKRKMAAFHIGTLVGEVDASKSISTDNNAFLQPKQWKRVTLKSVTEVSKDSKVFRFSWERPEQKLGLTIGQHVYVRLRRKVSGKDSESAEAGGELVQRAYTPVSRINDCGFIDMLVKIYYPSDQYPLGGRMTLGFAELSLGDSIEMKGPIGHFVWLGGGNALLHGQNIRVKQIGMICAGSGITPILQILRGIFIDTPNNDTDVWVLDVNRDVDDILCKDELDELAKARGSRFQLRYSLTGRSVPEDWVHSVGRLDRDMLYTYLPSPSPEGLICICGPSPMERAAKDNLIDMGWNGSQIVLF